MNNAEAINVAEGVIDARTHEHYIAAWQQLIDSGLAWTLQGWFGRRAMQMIEEGYCTPPKQMSPRTPREK